jgi:predicted signal transduction protein with EAL and GGDEF domain
LAQDQGDRHWSPVQRIRSAATIRAIVNFERDIGIVVIAQGVETEQQRDLRNLTDITTPAPDFHFSQVVGAERATERLRGGLL